MVAVGARGVMDAVVVVVVARTGVAQQSRHASHSRGSQPHLVSRRGLSPSPSPHGTRMARAPSPTRRCGYSEFPFGVGVASGASWQRWGASRLTPLTGRPRGQGGELLAVHRMPLLCKQKVIREPSVDLQVAPNQGQGTATSGGATSSDEPWGTAQLFAV